MQRKIIPDVVNDQTIAELSESAFVIEAAKLMRKRKIAAVVITENGVLKGIVTERDLSARVVAEGLDPNTTPLSKIMTPNPDTLGPRDKAFNALELMRVRGYRHIPVVDDSKVVGLVSIRDLYAAVQTSLEEDIREHEAFIFGENYGPSH